MNGSFQEPLTRPERLKLARSRRAAQTAMSTSANAVYFSSASRATPAMMGSNTPTVAIGGFYSARRVLVNGHATSLIVIVRKSVMPPDLRCQ
jgi:hypothetical protein